MNFFDSIYKFQDIIFTLFIIISYIIITLYVLGIIKDFPNFFISIDYYVKIYICLFLIWRFNPITPYFFKQKVAFDELDRKISFSAGLIILTTTFIKEYLVNIKNKVIEIL